MHVSMFIAAAGLLTTSAFAQTTFVVPAPAVRVHPPVIQVQPPVVIQTPTVVQTPLGPTVVTNQAGQVLTPDGSRVCPPGLAKKNNGCLPPGQAKKAQNNVAVMGAHGQPAHVTKTHPVQKEHPGKGGKHRG